MRTLGNPLGRFRSLQARFLAINLPLVLASVVLLFGAFEYNAYSRALGELEAKLDRIVASQSAVLAESTWNLDTERIQLILQATADDPDIRAAVVHDDMGNFLGGVGQARETAQSGPLVAGEKIVYSRADRSEVIGELRVALTDARVRADFHDRMVLAATLGGLIVLSVVISALVANRWTIGIPLRRLLHSIDRTESGGARYPVEWRSADEIGAVVDAFNRLQARQQRYESALHKARDELERRVAERTAELARARDAAEAANKAKTGFLANMSHELRTPLNAVIGFAEVLEGEVLGELGNSRYRDYARDIRESGTHLLDLINDLLDLSKAEAGKLVLTEEPVDLGEAVEVSIAMVQPRAEAAQVTLINDVPDALPPVTADDRKIKQVLLNLLTNAVKFTPAGGEVRIAVSQDSGGVQVAVTDTGIGISAADLERVMEPFAQVDSSFARKYEGTGLGLPLVKSLVELHDGRLRIDSAPGEGTRVVVVLPAARIASEIDAAE
jgi:signal transduction histidine kinase